MTDPYKVLGVSRDASDDEVKKASGDLVHLVLVDIQEAMVAMDMAVIISMAMILQQCI